MVDTPESVDSIKPGEDSPASDKTTDEKLGKTAMDLLAEENIAINFDLKEDRKELINDETERWFNKEKNSKGFWRRVKYNFFERYYKTKHKRELSEGKAKTAGGETIDDLLRTQNTAAYERFAKSILEKEDAYIHEGFGEKLEQDTKTTEKVIAAIKAYAQSNERLALLKKSGTTSEEITKAKQKIFNAAIGKELGENATLKENTYFTIAERAVSKAKIDENWGEDLAKDGGDDTKKEAAKKAADAITSVLEGFTIYNAIVREGSRSKQSLDTIDKIVDKLTSHEGGEIGRFVKPEYIAAAGGIVSLIGKSFLNKAARLIIPVGGIAVSSAFAGAREHRRVNQDRERMLRDHEIGLDYGNDASESGDKPLSRAERKRQKYENKIKETLYETKSASGLTKELDDALATLESSEDNAAALKELGKIYGKVFAYRARSDEGKGLITYSNIEKRGDERLALDVALVKAKLKLRNVDDDFKAQINEAMSEGSKEVSDQINKDVAEKDKDFRKKRAALVAKRVAKTAAFGALTFLGSQEIMATFDPNKISLAEELGLNINGPNATDAERTILASGVHAIFGTNPTPTSSNIADVLSDNNINTNSGTTTEQSTTEYAKTDPSNGTQFKGDVKWTSSQINEQGIPDSKIANGTITTNMSGDSYLNGQALNYDSLAENGGIKGMVIINGARYEVNGVFDPATHQITFGNVADNGFIETVSGDKIQLFDANGNKLYQFFEVGAKQPNGEWDVFATNVGTGNGSAYNGEFLKASQVITRPSPNLVGTSTSANIPHPAQEVAPASTITRSAPNLVSVGTATRPAPEGLSDMARNAMNNALGGSNTATAAEGISTAGIPFAPFNARRGLGEARPITTPTSTPESTTTTAESESTPGPTEEEKAEIAYNEAVNKLDELGPYGYYVKNAIMPVLPFVSPGFLVDGGTSDYRGYWDGLDDDNKKLIVDSMLNNEPIRKTLSETAYGEEIKKASADAGLPGLSNFLSWLFGNADELIAESKTATSEPSSEPEPTTE